MNAQPIPASLFKRARQLEITQINLHFDGGSDEGNLHIFFSLETEGGKYTDEVVAFKNEVESWAWNAYDYNGAGEGIPYGDDYIYDLILERVKHISWHYSPISEADNMPFEILEQE
jgi:hypothetical protein